MYLSISSEVTPALVLWLLLFHSTHQLTADSSRRSTRCDHAISGKMYIRQNLSTFLRSRDFFSNP